MTNVCYKTVRENSGGNFEHERNHQPSRVDSPSIVAAASVENLKV